MPTAQIVIGTISVLLMFAGLNFGALQWLFNRHDRLREENSKSIAAQAERINEAEKELLRLRALLPLEYVRREDWIRFSNTLEAKLDAMRAEMREEQQRLRTEMLEHIAQLNRAA
jgi:hypothetical protein